jgi:hypothetical protein
MVKWLETHQRCKLHTPFSKRVNHKVLLLLLVSTQGASVIRDSQEGCCYTNYEKIETHLRKFCNGVLCAGRQATSIE